MKTGIIFIIFIMLIACSKQIPSSELVENNQASIQHKYTSKKTLEFKDDLYDPIIANRTTVQDCDESIDAMPNLEECEPAIFRIPFYRVGLLQIKPMLNVKMLDLREELLAQNIIDSEVAKNLVETQSEQVKHINLEKDISLHVVKMSGTSELNAINLSSLGYSPHNPFIKKTLMALIQSTHVDASKANEILDKLYQQLDNGVKTREFKYVENIATAELENNNIDYFFIFDLRDSSFAMYINKHRKYN